jgi:hypothetical protein
MEAEKKIASAFRLFVRGVSLQQVIDCRFTECQTFSHFPDGLARLNQHVTKRIGMARRDVFAKNFACLVLISGAASLSRATPLCEYASA